MRRQPKYTFKTNASELLLQHLVIFSSMGNIYIAVHEICCQRSELLFFFFSLLQEKFPNVESEFQF